jgi:PLAT/LH2 domain
MKANVCLVSLAMVFLSILILTPLAAADVAYTITVETGTVANAGTDANVVITLGSGAVPTNASECDEFPQKALQARGLGDFERAQTDVFRISDRDLDNLPWICLSLSKNTSSKPGWFVNTVKVQKEGTSLVWRFVVFQFLDFNNPPDSNSVVALLEAPLNHTVDTIVLPYEASGYVFKTDPNSELPFQPAVAAFGSGGNCPLQSTVKTLWPINSELTGEPKCVDPY